MLTISVFKAAGDGFVDTAAAASLFVVLVLGRRVVVVRTKSILHT